MELVTYLGSRTTVVPSTEHAATGPAGAKVSVFTARPHQGLPGCLLALAEDLTRVLPGLCLEQQAIMQVGLRYNVTIVTLCSRGVDG